MTLRDPEGGGEDRVKQGLLKNWPRRDRAYGVFKVIS